MRRTSLIALVLMCSLLSGCERLSTPFRKSALPDMGPRLPATVRMNFDPALTAAIARYADACNHPQELRIGAELEDARRVIRQALETRIELNTSSAARNP